MMCTRQVRTFTGTGHQGAIKSYAELSWSPSLCMSVVKRNTNDSYQADFHRQSFVGGSTALQLLQGFALVRNRRVIVLVKAGRVAVAVAAAEAGVGAPVGQAVASPKVIDVERLAGHVKV